MTCPTLQGSEGDIETDTRQRVRRLMGTRLRDDTHDVVNLGLGANVVRLGIEQFQAQDVRRSLHQSQSPRRRIERLVIELENRVRVRLHGVERGELSGIRRR